MIKTPYIAPSYYRAFACLAGQCRHSCCVGWEIDVDEASLARYRRLQGDIGRRLNEAIDESGEAACFRLTDDERCPFLNRDGLCDLILAEGEDILCQICADHPRFRNFFSDRTEIGLGLCCEAAGRLILTHAEPVWLEVIEETAPDDALTDEEAALLALRDRLTGVMQDRALPVEQRLRNLPTAAGLTLPPIDHAHWCGVLLSLERLDEAWTDRMQALQACLEPGEAPCSPEWEIAFEQLAVYLLFRHLPGMLDDGDAAGRIAFVWLIVSLLRDLCALHRKTHGSVSIDDFIELCRLYSSEIEYSDENMLTLLSELDEWIRR